MLQKHVAKRSTMHTRLRHILLFSQCFGLLPVNGLLKNDPDNLQFKWFALKTIYSIGCGLMLVPISLMSTYYLFTHTIRLRLTSLAIFYTNSMLSNVAFLNVARKWPKLMKKWQRIENKMENYNSKPTELNRRIKAICFLFFTLSFLEQLFSYWKNGRTPESKDTFSLDLFIKRAYFFLVDKESSTITFFNVILVMINFIATFSWTFNDVFIMIISCELAERFKQINDKIEDVSRKGISRKISWERLRVDYNRLCLIYDDLISATSSIVFISFTNSYYFILENFYVTVRLKQGFVENFYFYVMFALLIGRTLGLVSSTAKVHTESRKLLQTLVYLPSLRRHENFALERLILQMAHQNIAVTGLNLFYITQRSYLKILGTIVSYQLLLYQFKVPF